MSVRMWGVLAGWAIEPKVNFDAGRGRADEIDYTAVREQKNRVSLPGRVSTVLHGGTTVTARATREVPRLRCGCYAVGVDAI